MWWRYLTVFAGTGMVLAAMFWAELQYQPRIGDAHKKQQQYTEAIGETGKESVLPTKLFNWVNDAVEWTDSHHDFVLAISTVFLAAFTLALFAATLGLLLLSKRQAGDMQNLLTAAIDNASASASQVKAIEAQERVMREQAELMSANLNLTKTTAESAKTSANAAMSQVCIMIARESPVLYLEDWRIEPVGENVSNIGITSNTDYFPTVVARNIGRSTLQLQAFCVETVLGEFHTVFPKTPNYKEIIALGTIIRADDMLTLRSPRSIRFAESEANSIKKQERLLWMYGFIRYYNQFLTEDWDAGFCNIMYADGLFVRMDLPNYAYHRRYDAGDSR